MEPSLWIAFLDKDAAGGLAESIIKAWPEADAPGVLGLQASTAIMPDSSRLRMLAMWTEDEKLAGFCEKIVHVAPLTRKGATLRVPQQKGQTEVLVIYGPAEDTQGLLDERKTPTDALVAPLWVIDGILYKVWAFPISIENEEVIRRLAVDINRLRSLGTHSLKLNRPATVFFRMGRLSTKSG